MISNWAGYEGHLTGTWRIDSFLATREERAFFTTTNVADDRKALLQMIPAAAGGAGAVRASWESAGRCSEAHLLSVYETGETTLDGLNAIYAVLDLPDDDAGEILGRRAVEPEEARQFALAAARALQYLHERGLRHGDVRPSNIFPVGNTIKLSVDTIAPAEEGGRALDLRQLGNTLVEVLTGGTDPRDASRLPIPFREIAIGCFESPGREWTADRVLRTLSDPSPGAAPLSSQAPRRRWPIFAGVAGLGIVALIGYRSTQAPARNEISASPAVAVAPRSTAAEPEPAAEQPGRLRTGSSWAVIAATYKNFSAARKRAESIGSRSPQLHADVYPPTAGNSYYYVVLGSGLTRDEAGKMRDIARRLGAPADTYVTKLNEK